MTGFWNRRDEHRLTLATMLREYGPLAFLEDRGGNIGDALIREGTRHFLDDFGLEYRAVVTDLQCVDSSQRTLLVRGNGGLDRYFHNFFPDVILKASKMYRNVVILPSGFDPGEPSVARSLEPANVVAIARDLRSFALLAPYGSRLAFIDCALSHRRFVPFTESTDTGGLLLSLRQDNGSPLAGVGLEPNGEINRDLSMTAHGLNDWLDQIGDAGTVVTDRCHVAAASILMGKKVIAIDPYDRKLSEYASFNFGNSFEQNLSFRSVSWLKSAGLAVPIANHKSGNG